jgi:hypothetical protein
MFSDWKTTLAGYAAGALNMFANGTNWKQILASVAIAALGHVASDSKKWMTRETELWILAGLLVLLVYTGGTAIQSISMETSQALIDKLAYAIAVAEGFFVSGSRSQRNHNPGDFETDITRKGVTMDGPYVVYANDTDGWEALKVQVSLMLSGRSRVYTPSMTISDVAYKYADGEHDPVGASNWAENVASQLGVDTSTRLQDLTA